MNKILKLVGVSALLLTVAACGTSKISKEKYNDGIYEYTHKSEGKHISYVHVKLEIKDNKIIKSDAEFLDENQDVKDENYCKGMPEEVYKMAQKSVEASNKYAGILLKKQNPDKVDIVAGATDSNKLFKEAVWKALDLAKK